MYKKKDSNKGKNSSEAKEPPAVYSTTKIKTFSSFEEEEKYTADQRASLSYDERMAYIEKLRKIVFSQFLLPDGTWPSIAKSFKIMPPYINESG